MQCIFRSCNTCTFNAMRYDENPFTCQCKKEEENAEGFQILHCYWSFLSDIIAVKGLRAATLHVHPCVWVWLALFWCGISLIRFSPHFGDTVCYYAQTTSGDGNFFFFSLRTNVCSLQHSDLVSAAGYFCLWWL